jgi:hypothetical protein
VRAAEVITTSFKRFLLTGPVFGGPGLHPVTED